MKKRNMSGYIPSPNDSRDYELSRLIKCYHKLPSSFIVKCKNLHVFDQVNTNMCVSCAIAAIKQIIETNQIEDNEPFSPAYIYANRKMTDYRGEGMIPRQALKILKEYGICHNVHFPGVYTYESAKKYYSLSKSKLDNLAKPYKISSYYRLKTIDDIKNAIYSTGGALVAYSVYDCLFDPDENGLIHFNEMDTGEYHGGHQMLAIGWNETGFIVLNSWSEDYGIGNEDLGIKGGLVIIPYNYHPEEAWAVTDDITEAKICGTNSKSRKSFLTKIMTKIRNIIG